MLRNWTDSPLICGESNQSEIWFGDNAGFYLQICKHRNESMVTEYSSCYGYHEASEQAKDGFDATTQAFLFNIVVTRCLDISLHISLANKEISVKGTQTDLMKFIECINCDHPFGKEIEDKINIALDVSVEQVNVTQKATSIVKDSIFPPAPVTQNQIHVEIPTYNK